MSSSSSAVTAQYVAIYQELRTSTIFTIVVTTLLLHDVLLTSGKEYRFIWRSSKPWFSRALYVWNRYMILLYLFLNLGTIPSMSDTSCASLVWTFNVLQILNLIGPATFTTLRIYALSRKNRTLGGVALALSMTPFVLNASTAYQFSPVNPPPPQNCTVNNTPNTSLNIGLTIAARSSLILVDSLAVVVTWRQTRTGTQLGTGTVKRPYLEQVIWENGIIYFCTLASLNVANIVLVILTDTTQTGVGPSYVLGFIDIISSVLNSRFLLALHETNARREGADTSISSVSFNIGSRRDPRAASPALPQFLGPIGGQIYSFDDDDDDDDLSDDVESLDFAPPSQDRPQSEFEGELESDGDRENAA